MTVSRRPQSAADAVRSLVAHPIDRLVRRWNWKSAIVSALIRSAIFFSANLSAGPAAARAALTTELVFRLTTAGFYGAMTEAFRYVEPPWHGTVAAMILLPAVAHSLELAVHMARGTERLAASLSASMVFTVLSTSFNVYAMRRNVLIVGEGRGSLASDMKQMPRLIASFLAVPIVALRHRALRSLRNS